MTFYTSLSGLQASQTDMSTISNNLANVSTDGFKKSRTEFADVMASSVSTDPTKLVGSGAVVKANRQQFSEGNLITTSSSLDLAISGDGFFAVKTPGASSTTEYTRNGSFVVDANHFIVDGEGDYLQAYPVDAQGNATATGADGLANVQIPATSGAPQATSTVNLDVNLSSSASAPTKAFDRTDASTYNNATSTTIYDGSGNAETMTSYYVKNADAGDGTSSWSVHSFVGNQELTSGGTSPTTLTFGTSGAMTTTPSSVTFDAFTPAGSASQQTLTTNFAGTSQASSVFSLAASSQDGKAVGQLSGVTIDNSGVIMASFSNGDTQAIGKVAMANFANPTGLRQLGNSNWASTGVSGEAQLGTAGDNGYGSLMSGTLEGSNVDITEELVDLIAAQRNFQANAKALDTASQISQTIFNIQ